MNNFKHRDMNTIQIVVNSSWLSLHASMKLVIDLDNGKVRDWQHANIQPNSYLAFIKLAMDWMDVRIPKNTCKILI